ncbi:MAG: winged helix DNA-binding domain-containing protein [Chloroflexota bacterium]
MTSSVSAVYHTTWDKVLAWRMARHFLELPAAGGPIEVVRRLAGVQAQVASASEMAVALRLTNPKMGELTEALNERTLIKIWVMRGTLHVLLSDVAGTYLALIAAGKSWERPSWQKTFASAAQMNTLMEVVPGILDGRVLSREELITEVLERTRDAHLAEGLRSGWGSILKPLAWKGLLCHGPAVGNRASFTCPRSWVPDWRELPPVEDAARIAIPAYLGAYGPASMEAFDTWLTRKTTSKTSLRAWFDAAGNALTVVDIEGHRAFARTEDIEEIMQTSPSTTVRLLGAFDQYVLGLGTGDTQIIPAVRRPDVSRTAGWISSVVVAGGRVVGTWEIRESTLEVTHFKESERPQTACLEKEVGRITTLLGTELALSVRTT